MVIKHLGHSILLSNSPHTPFHLKHLLHIQALKRIWLVSHSLLKTIEYSLNFLLIIALLNARIPNKSSSEEQLKMAFTVLIM